MTAEKLNFREQIVNKFIEMILSRMIDAERLQVRVKTNIKQLRHGELEGLTIEMYGFQLRPHLRVAELGFNIGAAAVNLQSIKRRQIELLHPSVGSLCLVITQEQLTNLFNAQLVSALDKQVEQIRIKQINCQLADSKMTFDINLIGAGKIDQSCTITPKIETNGNALSINQWNVEGQEPPSEFVQAISTQVSDILNLKDISNRGTTFNIQQLDIESGKLTLLADTRIDHFPKA